MSVAVTVDKLTCGTRENVHVYENTKTTYFSFSVQGGLVKVFENDRDEIKKSKMVAIYNHRHVVLVQGDSKPPAPKDENY